MRGSGGGTQVAAIDHDPEAEPILRGTYLPRNALIMAMSMLTIMAGTTISPALPGLVEHFADVPNIALTSQMILTVPAIAIACTAPFVGMVADRFGRRLVLLIALVFYGVGGSAGLYLNSIEGILFSRLLLGVSVGAVMTATTTLVADYFTGQARNRFFGIRSSFISFGGVVFLIGGGLLSELGWRAPFGVYLFALVLAPFAYVLITEPDAAARADEPGSVGTSLLREHLRHAPVYALGFLHFLAFYYVFLEVPFRLKELGTASTAMSGIVLGTMTLFSSAFSLVFPALNARLGRAAMMGLAFLPIACGFFVASVAGNGLVMGVAMAIVGIGNGILIPNLSGMVVSNATPSMRARVAGVMSASVFLGQFLSPTFSFPIE